MARNNDIGVLATVIGIILSFKLAVFGVILFIAAKLFEYSLFTITGKDVPWYGDLLGALVLNGLNFPIAIVCLIANLTGAPSPWITW